MPPKHIDPKRTVNVYHILCRYVDLVIFLVICMYEKCVFLRVTSVLLFLRTILRGPRAEIILVFVVSPWRRAASASIMGCGGRVPTTQHIAVTLTPWVMRQYAGSRAYGHHSHSKLTLMVPHFFLTFFNGMIIDN